MADRDLDKDSYGHPGRSVLDDGNGAGGVTLGSSGAPGVATLSRFDRLVDALIETYRADIARLQIDLVLARQERDEFRESGRRYVECLTVERDGAVSRAKLCLAARRGAQEALTDERRAHEDTQAALAAAREQVDTMAAAWAAIREAQSGHHDSTEATHEEPKCDAAAWCAGCMPSYEDRSGVVVHEEDCPVDTLDKRAGKLRTCECCGERASTTCTECVDEVEDKGKADLAALAHDVRRAEEEYERANADLATERRLREETEAGAMALAAEMAAMRDALKAARMRVKVTDADISAVKLGHPDVCEESAECAAWCEANGVTWDSMHEGGSLMAHPWVINELAKKVGRAPLDVLEEIVRATAEPQPDDEGGE